MAETNTIILLDKSQEIDAVREAIIKDRAKEMFDINPNTKIFKM
jgi:hypothetical protein